MWCLFGGLPTHKTIFLITLYRQQNMWHCANGTKQSPSSVEHNSTEKSRILVYSPSENQFSCSCLIGFLPLPPVLPAKIDFRTAFTRGASLYQTPMATRREIIGMVIKCLEKTRFWGLELDLRINWSWKPIVEDFNVLARIQAGKLQGRTKNTAPCFCKTRASHPLPRKLIRVQSKHISSCWSSLPPL